MFGVAHNITTVAYPTCGRYVTSMSASSCLPHFTALRARMVKCSPTILVDHNPHWYSMDGVIQDSSICASECWRNTMLFTTAFRATYQCNKSDRVDIIILLGNLMREEWNVFQETLLDLQFVGMLSRRGQAVRLLPELAVECYVAGSVKSMGFVLYPLRMEECLCWSRIDLSTGISWICLFEYRRSTMLFTTSFRRTLQWYWLASNLLLCSYSLLVFK